MKSSSRGNNFEVAAIKFMLYFDELAAVFCFYWWIVRKIAE